MTPSPSPVTPVHEAEATLLTLCSRLQNTIAGIRPHIVRGDEDSIDLTAEQRGQKEGLEWVLGLIPERFKEAAAQQPPTWSFDPSGPSWARGRQLIMQAKPGQFLCSEKEQWLPGVYASLPAAKRAFEVPRSLLTSLRGPIITEAALAG